MKSKKAGHKKLVFYSRQLHASHSVQYISRMKNDLRWNTKIVTHSGWNIEIKLYEKPVRLSIDYRFVIEITADWKSLKILKLKQELADIYTNSPLIIPVDESWCINTDFFLSSDCIVSVEGIHLNLKVDYEFWVESLN
jgi:hypothetical protein